MNEYKIRWLNFGIECMFFTFMTYVALKVIYYWSYLFQQMPDTNSRLILMLAFGLFGFAWRIKVPLLRNYTICKTYCEDYRK